MNRLDYPAGFYGKLPSHGDFLSRRLPRQFIEPWDEWLQGGLAASREQLGREWLNIFLVSPIWQFALSPGLCGDDAWAGVMMPSVDRVGRYFPLTLAAKVNDYPLAKLYDPLCGWFETLSQLALSTLEYKFDLQAFDEQLGRLHLSDFLPAQPGQSHTAKAAANSARQAYKFELDHERDTPQAFAELGETLSNRFLAHCSYWRSAAYEDARSTLLVCEGLPPIDAYAGFLNGAWPQRGWDIYSSRLSGLVRAEPGNDSHRSIPMPEPGSNYPIFADDSRKRENASAAIITPSPQPPADKNSFGLSVVGLRRKLNEDAILERGDAGMWAVADGMGGHSAGDVASQTLIAALNLIPCIEDLEHYSEQVASCLHAVNRDLVALAQSLGSGHLIGSTIVVLLISGQQFRYLWAGDSRLYRYRQGVLEQLTYDHSLYNESIRQGLSPMDGSLEDGRGNVITRAVGADLQLQLDCGQGEIDAQDIFILCSDGLDKELAHEDIAALCSLGSAREITQNLVHEAENRGGRDNISVIVVKT